MTLTRRSAALVVVVLSASGAGTARAEDPADRAVAHYDRGSQHCREGRFREAVDELLSAFRLSADANLLYNIARSYEGLGDLRQAVYYYRRYLDEAPSVNDRPAIEQRIRNFERRIGEEETVRRAAAQRVPAERPLGPWPWVTLGLGVAALGTGGGFGVAALARDGEERRDSVSQQDAVRLRGEAESAAATANVLFVAGGVVAAGGIVLLLLNTPAEATIGVVGRF